MCFLTMEHGSTQKMNLRPIKLSPINKMTRTQLNYSPTPLLSSPRPRLTSVRTSPVSPLLPPHGEAEAMQAAAGRARRLLASPAASGIPGILSGPIPGRKSCAEGLLLHRLDGAPTSPSSPHHARGFSSSCFASRSPCELPHLISIKYVLCALLPSALLAGLLGAAFRQTGGGRAEWHAHRTASNLEGLSLSLGFHFSCSEWEW
jgi:hypothetical protein